MLDIIRAAFVVDRAQGGGVYTLQVFYADSATGTETYQVKKAHEVLTCIPTLLEKHEGCERVVVFLEAVRLFAVDCKGNRLPD